MQLMAFPPCPRDFNPMINLWSIVKQKVYMLLWDIISSKFFRDELRNALADAVNDVSMDTTEKVTSSVDNRLLLVAQNKGRYNDHLSQSTRWRILFKDFMSVNVQRRAFIWLLIWFVKITFICCEWICNVLVTLRIFRHKAEFA